MKPAAWPCQSVKTVRFGRQPRSRPLPRKPRRRRIPAGASSPQAPVAGQERPRVPRRSRRATPPETPRFPSGKPRPTGRRARNPPAADPQATQAFCRHAKAREPGEPPTASRRSCGESPPEPCGFAPPPHRQPQPLWVSLRSRPSCSSPPQLLRKPGYGDKQERQKLPVAEEPVDGIFATCHADCAAPGVIFSPRAARCSCASPCRIGCSPSGNSP